MGDLGDGDVVAGLGGRSRAHRHAEAVAARLAAVDGNYERLPASRRVPAERRHPIATRVDGVEDAKGGQFTGTDPEEGVARRFGERVGGESILPDRPRPEHCFGGVEVFFPTRGADHIPKELLVAAVLEAIPARLLQVGPPFGKILDPCDVVVDEGLIPDSRPDHAVASFCQRVDQATDTRLARDIDLAHSRISYQ